MENTPKKPETRLSEAQLVCCLTFALSAMLISLYSSSDIIKVLMVAGVGVILYINVQVINYRTVRWLKSVSGGIPRRRIKVCISGLDVDEPQVSISTLHYDQRIGKTVTRDAVTSIPNSPAALAAVRVVANMMTVSPQRVSYYNGDVIVDLTALELSESEVDAWRDLNKIYKRLSEEIADGYTGEGKSLKQTVINKLEKYATNDEEVRS